MAKRNTETRRIRDLPAEVQLEIQRAKAKKLTEDVKAADARAAAREHQAQIERLKGGT